ncbi:K(+)/H(+) antiporter [Tulasnella sp. UAMH 9824]|nr:K(+)/H(+) antiporter [Tulasnella sp. UAMH 9824]
MPALYETIVDVGRQLVSRKAAEQGGILSGDNPASYNPSDPLRLWVIQLVLIVGMTQLLSIFFGRIRQPRVIAEVIGGILLGPTVMGRIPNFSKSIFPTESLPFLSLVSTIGLVLFLFLVGLELDVSVVKKNARASTIISAAGILLPFGVGAGIAVPIYNEFVDTENVTFGHFLLFVGVAISITAFPVLCRILTETRLLDTDVGVIVLSAGVGNDVVGWILLALTVALVNASSGLTALWVLLTCVGFILFLLYPVKWVYRALARYSGSLDRGEPTTMMMTVTLILVFASAFFTDIIGVHAIFGGFIAGLIIPKDGGYSIKIVEKLEDLVSICFLPLYFALSGLKTNLGLLDNGITWAYVIIICLIAFFGKFIGCAVSARFMGFNLRESGAIGALMSCKGLVELIVLNIGLQAGILDTRLFSIFVLHAIVLTFITTPLTLWIYPPHVRNRITGAVPHDSTSGTQPTLPYHPTVDGLKTRFTIVLHKMEHVPILMNLVQYLQPPIALTGSQSSDSTKKEKEAVSPVVTADGTPKVSIDALRLMELSQRTSDVMKNIGQDELAHRDTVLSVFRTFGSLNQIPVASALSVVTEDEYAGVVASRAQQFDSDLVIIPWSFGTTVHGDEKEGITATTVGPSSGFGHTLTHNPFEGLFGKSQAYDRAGAVSYSHFIRRVFAESPTDVGLFIDSGLSSFEGAGIYGQHVFLPFFGGPDDRLALEYVVQMCMHPSVSATIIRITKTEVVPVVTNDTVDEAKAEAAVAANLTVLSATGFPDTVYPRESSQTHAQSEMADNIAWTKYTSASPDTPRSAALRSALGRVQFSSIESDKPLKSILDRTSEEGKKVKDEYTKKSLLVVCGRGRRLAGESHASELRDILASHGGTGAEVRKTLGDVACALVVSNVKAGLLVVQAAPKSTTEA